MNGFSLLRPLLHQLDPERVHRLGIEALKRGWIPARAHASDPVLQTSIFGLNFSNPVGLAAGFDKNAEAVDALLSQGFGFVETGTVTPKAQEGNPRPRIFRLPEDEAVINRLGFNGDGLDVFLANLQRRKKTGVVGVNIGKNRDTESDADDYIFSLKAVAPHADYVTINVSSPNTEGLRNLQQKQTLDHLLTVLLEARASLARRVPLLLKIAPDLDAKRREDIAEVVLARNIDGLIVSNTTIQRPHQMQGTSRNEQGGLSGRPLFTMSTELLREMHRLTQKKIPIVGVGGVFSAQDAYMKIRAGASLVQLYTVLVYRGFGAVRRIHEGLAQLLKRDGFTSVSQAVGADNC